MERIEKGEAVGYVIIAVGVIGFAARRLPGDLPDPDAHGRDAPARSGSTELTQRQPARPRARFRQDRSGEHRRRRRGRRAAHLRGRAARGAEARALPGLPASRRRGRPAARSGRHGDRHDHHLPEHHRVGLERSAADGQRHRPGDDRDRARSRHRRPAALHERRARDRCRAASCRSSTSRARACSPRASSDTARRQHA